MNKEILLKKRLILASQSPRRRELIQKLGLPFEAEVSDVDETIPEGMDAVQVPEYLSPDLRPKLFTISTRERMCSWLARTR